MSDLPSEDVADVAETFHLLGDATRLGILFTLVDRGSLSVGEIAADVGIAASGVSNHLRLLRFAAVVETERDGRFVRYRLADDHVRTLLDVARAHSRHR